MELAEIAPLGVSFRLLLDRIAAAELILEGGV